MKQPLYPEQNHNGASHRMYVDTPSLVGLRTEPIWFRLGSRTKRITYRNKPKSLVPNGTSRRMIHD